MKLKTYNIADPSYLHIAVPLFYDPGFIVVHRNRMCPAVMLIVLAVL